MKKMNTFEVLFSTVKRKLRSKYFLLVGILGLFSFVTLCSYAVFMVSTNGYRVSELFVSKLMYGVSITEAVGGNATISGKSVTVPANETVYLYVDISSLNPVDSKYQLAYSSSSANALVYYSSKTSWNPQGLLLQDGSTIDSKQVRVVIENKGSTAATVTFEVYGGYSFNSYTAINVDSGYTRVTDLYDEVVAVTSSELLTTVVESDNACSEGEVPCNYGGESTNNYVQYPINEDKTKNIWRVIGTYNIDGDVVAKMISTTASTSTYSNAVSSLNSFYSTLTDSYDYILETNKFLCNGSTCSASGKYSNIGLINVSEYEAVGGSNSYLANSSSYFSMTEPSSSTVSNITSSGIEEVSFDTSSGIRGVVYVQSDVKVVGSGTATDPYTFEPKGDVNIIAYTYYGETGVLQEFPSQTDPYIVDSVTCTNGTLATWDNEKWELVLTNINVPTYCTVDFKEGYKVTMTPTNGTVSPTSQAVGYNGTATFTGSPSTDYTADGATVSCNNGATGSITADGTITVKNVTADTACTVVFEADADGLYSVILDNNPNRATRAAGTFGSIYTTSNNGNTIHTATGEGGATTYYFAGQVTNNYVKFGTNSSGAELWWRIVRINEDNSVRLIYAGTAKDDTAAFISTSQAFNSSYNMSYYVGYERSTTQHGTGTNSDIKGVVDTWYTNNLADEADYLSKTAIYCNDRSTVTGGTWAANPSSTFYYDAYYRLAQTTKAPVFTCTNSADKFTVSNTTGNGALENPIALITADEISYAGGLVGTNNTSYYIAQNASSGANYWWTMSPCYWGSAYSYAGEFLVGGSTYTGYLNNGGVSGTLGVRPVVSLKSCVLWSGGNGTSDNPYTVTINDACKSAIN